MSDDELRELLNDMRDDPLPPDSLARIRALVSERTQETAWPRWWAAVLAFCLACVAVFIVLSRPVSPRQVLPVLVHAQPKPAEAVRQIFPQPSPGPVHHLVAKRSLKKQEPPVVIRIETADPKVVILLIGE